MQNRQYLILPKCPLNFPQNVKVDLVKRGGGTYVVLFGNSTTLQSAFNETFFRGRMATTRHLVAVKLE